MNETPQTTESVAYYLMKRLINADNKNPDSSQKNGGPDRKEVAAAYKEALKLARGED